MFKPQKMQIMQIMEKKKVTRGFQHGAGRIIEYRSHRTAQSDAVRRAFSYDSRIVGCRIVYIIFLIVVIA